MNLQNYELNRTHRDDALREAEYQRLAQQGHHHQPQRSAALNTLGRQMIKIGEWLQNQ